MKENLESRIKVS